MSDYDPRDLSGYAGYGPLAAMGDQQGFIGAIARDQIPPPAVNPVLHNAYRQAVVESQLIKLWQTILMNVADQKIYACLAGLNVGDPVNCSAADDTATLALSDTEPHSRVMGFCGYKPTTTTCLVYPFHLATGLTSLTRNGPVYLTDAGGYSATPGTITKIAGTAISATEAVLFAAPAQGGGEPLFAAWVAAGYHLSQLYADGGLIQSDGAGALTTLKDTTKNVTLNGIMGVSKAGSFNPSNYITTTDTGLPMGAAVRSFCFWVNTTDAGPDTIFDYGSSPGGELCIEMAASGYILIHAGHPFGTGYYMGAIPINDGNWHFVVCTFDGTDWNVYVDNVLDTNFYGSGPATTTRSCGQVEIGYGSILDSYTFTGKLQMLAAFDHVLDSTELAAYWNGGAGHMFTGSETGLLSCWTLNNTAADLMSVNNGTWTGTATYAAGFVADTTPTSQSITQTGNVVIISADVSASSFSFADNSSGANWAGSPPTNTNDAINRIAAAVARLLDAPIPWEET